MEEFAKKAETLKADWITLVRKNAIDVLGCDETCVNDCTNKEFIQFGEIGQCIKFCQCNQNVIDLTMGEVNTPALMAYNQYDVKAWSFFKVNKDKIL